jgi:hypothetical protein
LPAGAPLPAFTRAVLAARHWPLADRLALLAAASGWLLRRFRCPPGWTVQQLCGHLPRPVLTELIDPLCVAALNTPMAQASAPVFLRVLRDALFSGRGSADLLLPRAPLSDLLPAPAWRWLAAHGAALHTGQRVTGLQAVHGGWQVDGTPFDAVVLACSATEAAPSRCFASACSGAAGRAGRHRRSAPPDPVSLKDISESHRPAPVHRAPHPQRPGHRPLRRPARGRQLPAGHAPAGTGQPGQGTPGRARRRAGPMRELHKLTHQPVNLSVRQGDEIVYIERAYSERSGMQVVRAVGGRAPLHLTSVGKLFLAHDDPQRVRAYATRTGPDRPHAQQHHRGAGAGARTGPGAPERHGPRQRRTGTGRALHGRRHLRRPGQAGGRPVDLGAGRPAGRILAGPGASHGRADLESLGHRAA